MDGKDRQKTETDRGQRQTDGWKRQTEDRDRQGDGGTGQKERLVTPLTFDQQNL